MTTSGSGAKTMKQATLDFSKAKPKPMTESAQQLSKSSEPNKAAKNASEPNKAKSISNPNKTAKSAEELIETETGASKPNKAKSASKPEKAESGEESAEDDAEDVPLTKSGNKMLDKFHDMSVKERRRLVRH